MVIPIPIPMMILLIVRILLRDGERSRLQFLFKLAGTVTAVNVDWTFWLDKIRCTIVFQRGLGTL